MPAKKQISREAILEAAIDIVRKSGIESVNARSLARKLNCSTQPVYLSFKNMEELKDAVIHAADDVYQRFVSEELKKGHIMPYKAGGVAYIRFAKEEKGLFKALFMRERTIEQAEYEKRFSDNSIKEISKRTGLDYESAYRFHIEMWAFGHGIASMLVTGYLDFDIETADQMMSDVFLGLVNRYKDKGSGADENA